MYLEFEILLLQFYHLLCHLFCRNFNPFNIFVELFHLIFLLLGKSTRCMRLLIVCSTNFIQVELEDPVENIGAKLVRQAAAKTNDLAGDGTTTSVVLAQGLIAEGVKVGTV